MPARVIHQPLTYFNWLLEKVENEYEPGGAGSHRLLLRKLYEIEFYATLERDNDRLYDGLDMRNGYDNYIQEGFGYFVGKDYILTEAQRNAPCSVLEMMVGMCEYFENHVMSNDIYGNRFGKWFWMMLENAGLTFLNDASYTHEADDYIASVIRRICDRRYEANGDGSFFPLRNPKRDMRTVDLWYQLQWYVTENFNGDW